MKSSLLMSVTCAVALVIPGLAGAQDHNPFSNSYTSPFADFDPTPSPAPWPEMPPVYQPYQAPTPRYDPNPYPFLESSPRREYKSDAQILEESLYPYGRPDPADRLIAEQRRRQEMRNAEIFRCTSIDRNPAARSACLEAIR